MKRGPYKKVEERDSVILEKIHEIKSGSPTESVGEIALKKHSHRRFI